MSMGSTVDIGRYILDKIKSAGLYKSDVYHSLGMTQRGFNLMIKNNTYTLDRYLSICDIVGFPASEYFIIYDKSKNNLPEEPTSFYVNDTENKKTDTAVSINSKEDLIEYQRRQIDKLTEAVNRLTKIIDTGGHDDTVSN